MSAEPLSAKVNENKRVLVLADTMVKFTPKSFTTKREWPVCSIYRWVSVAARNGTNAATIEYMYMYPSCRAYSDAFVLLMNPICCST